MHILNAVSKGIEPYIYRSLLYKYCSRLHNINVISQQVTQNNRLLKEHA